MTPDELRKTIEARSDQLNAEDLIGGPRTLTIAAVTAGTAEQPVVVHYEGDEDRPWKPCKTMRRLLVAAWGDDAREWKGRRLKVYHDPEVKFGGVKVGGIRVSEMSHLDKPLTVALSISRGKRQPVTVKPLEALHDRDWKALILQAKDMARLNGLAHEMKDAGVNSDVLRKAWKMRRDDLQAQSQVLASTDQEPVDKSTEVDEWRQDYDALYGAQK